MSYSLEFSHRHVFQSASHIRIPVTLLSTSSLWTDVVAAVDTASTFCVFDRTYGEVLGLDIESGIRQRIGTATGSFYAYGHELALVVFDLEWQAVVYFAESAEFAINVVGRVRFLDRLKIGLVDYEQLLLLGLYNES